MPRESLVRQTSHIMGYDRTGAHVQKRVNSAIDLLLRSGRVFESNNQIKLTKNE